MALPHAGPGEIVDLAALGGGLANAKTAALVKTKAFEAVRLIVSKGKVIPSHQVAGAITLQCLEGRVLLGLESSKVELAAGHWVFLEGGARHSVEGMEDSSLLLTILLPG